MHDDWIPTREQVTEDERRRDELTPTS